MGDQGDFDPCECVWNHEMAMRRLISFLRQSQSYCTDTECFENVVGPRTQTEGSDNFMLMFVLFAFVIFMYFLRPRPSRIANITKPNNGNNDYNGAPPAPPSVN